MAMRQISEIQMGFTARERLEASASGTPILQLRDLQPDGTVNASQIIKCELGSVAPRYLVSDGDIVFRSRGDKNTAATVEGLESASVAVLPLVIIRPDGALVDPRYLAWFINSDWAQGYFDKAAQGTKLRMISRGDLENLPVDLPDLATQRRIVEVDALAAEERRLTLRLLEIRQRLLTSTLRSLARNDQRSGPGNKQNHQ
ncbi:restriction endonuclease subunit S (plasmid) [Mesorhizobium sp. B2-1-8]|uniref:restriction endonuclease subunit S n=1 Tax=Mesorhizobium sp. B2-1-8 TaxID=2589967 RepID=UPI00112CCD2A|nr:restriction endonuclease subunit S [Mesorhizobium sp. B2-1-8]UCI23014.1 restriction endonuclease subunit S [Mesorhizobium sp. B2-1-8]